MPAMPRVQEVVLPILRSALVPSLLPADKHVVTWVPDVDYREYPILNVRRLGGTRNIHVPTLYSRPVIELTAYGNVNIIETERLYESALEALYDAVRNQTQTPAGYLQSIRETLGATQFSSLYQDSWRIQGLIQLGVRTPRSN